MYIGLSLLVKYNGQIQEGKVIKIFPEELEIELKTGEIIQRKFWEVQKINPKNEEE